jgi:hypothetical protein
MGNKIGDRVLRKWYNAKQLVALLQARYGLNNMGVRKILGVSLKRVNELKRGERLTVDEARELVKTFNELEGKFEFEVEEF